MAAAKTAMEKDKAAAHHKKARSFCKQKERPPASLLLYLDKFPKSS